MIYSNIAQFLEVKDNKKENQLENKINKIENEQKMMKTVLFYHHTAILNLGFSVGINTELFTKNFNDKRHSIKTLTFDKHMRDYTLERQHNNRMLVLSNKRLKN